MRKFFKLWSNGEVDGSLFYKD